MIYAGDPWVQMPVKDLYDTQIMAMSINAAKDMYEKGQKQMEDFYTKYGDFISPIQKDMDWYNKNVTGKAQSLINYLYQNGVDPLRSVEGRAAISQLIYSMPTGDIAKLKQSAETAKEYIKNRGKLEAAGLYNPDLEERFLGFDLNNWDTIENGKAWDRVSPIQAKSLKELTESSYNNRTPHDLTKDEVLSFKGQSYDPRMKYKGFTDNDLLNIANTVAPGLAGTPWNDYFRDIAAKKVAASGKEVTDKNINAQLARDIADTQQEYLIKPIGDLDDWYKSQQLKYKSQQLNISRQRLMLDKLKQEHKDDVSSWTKRQQDASQKKNEMFGKALKARFMKWAQSYSGKGLDKTGLLAINDYYESTRHDLKGNTPDFNTAVALFNYGGSDPYTIRELNTTRKSNIVSFADNNLRPTRVAHVQWVGAEYTPGSSMNKFSQWLKQNAIEGESVGKVSTNHQNVASGYNIYEINRSVRVPFDQIAPYFATKYKSTDKILKNMEYLGLTVVLQDESTRALKTVDLNKEKGTSNKDVKWSNIKYIDIPSSRRLNNYAWDDSQVDVAHDLVNYTKSVAAKREYPHLKMNGNKDEEYYETEEE